MPFRLLLVGCGKMGAAILDRIPPELATVTVVDPMPRAATAQDHIIWHKTPDQIDKGLHPDMVLLAVKPQQMAATLPAYAHYAKAVFVSIAAGLTLPKLASLLSASRPIIRVMPNLPASVGAGMSVAVANAHVTAAQRDLCDRLLNRIGAAAWLENEILLDAVTALSGSGPAYIFALCDIMAKTGEALGLPPQLAALLARQTVIGSGALLAATADSAATLYQNVASPGGTTEAALKHLLAPDGFEKMIATAMTAAAQRSRELVHP